MNRLLAAAAALCCAACSSSASNPTASNPTAGNPGTDHPSAASAPASASTAPAAATPATTTATPAPGGRATSVATVTVTASTPASTSPEAQARRGSSPVRLDVTVRAEDEVDVLLARTSTSFRSAVRQELRRESGDCANQQYQIDVTWYWPDDQAVGAAGGCGGAVRLWFRPSGGGWNHFDTQDTFACRTLHQLGVPEPMSAAQGGACYDDPQQPAHPYDPHETVAGASSWGRCPAPPRYQGDGSYQTSLCPDGSPARVVEPELRRAAPALLDLAQTATPDDVIAAGCESLTRSNVIWTRLAYEYVRAREEWGSGYPSVDGFADRLTDGTCPGR